MVRAAAIAASSTTRKNSRDNRLSIDIAFPFLLESSDTLASQRQYRRSRDLSQKLPGPVDYRLSTIQTIQRGAADRFVRVPDLSPGVHAGLSGLRGPVIVPLSAP